MARRRADLTVLAAAVAAAVMAFARVYIGALYTRDALAGIAVGNAVSVIGFWATRPVLVRLLRRAEEITLVRPLLTVADTAELADRSPRPNRLRLFALAPGDGCCRCMRPGL